MTVAATAATSSTAICCNDRSGGSGSGNLPPACGEDDVDAPRRDSQRGHIVEIGSHDLGAAGCQIACVRRFGITRRDANVVPAGEQPVDDRAQPAGGAGGEDHPTAPSRRRALKRRSRSALETTERLEKTIARLAMTGLSSPIAASGMTARL
jgi:hypothetical protein